MFLLQSSSDELWSGDNFRLSAFDVWDRASLRNRGIEHQENLDEPHDSVGCSHRMPPEYL